jgi:hypothetical protein
MSQNYSDIGYDANNLKQIVTDETGKTILSSIEADAQFGDGAMPGIKVSSGPNLSTFGFPDNFDSSYPFILPYYIDSSAKVTRATISLFFQPYRAYETAASAGGSTTSSASSSSSSGASSATTTSAGGGTTSSSIAQSSTVATTDTTGQTAHPHAYALYGTDDAGGATNYGPIRWEQTSDATHGHFYIGESIGAGNYKWCETNTTVSGHSHNVTITNPTHSHTVGDHNHDMPHTHNIDHTHTVGDHTHGITYGIYSSGYPTVVSITVDGVDVTTALGGPWNPTIVTHDFLDMDITQYTASSGTHTIQLTTTGQGRCIPLLIIKSVLGSKS